MALKESYLYSWKKSEMQTQLVGGLWWPLTCSRIYGISRSVHFRLFLTWIIQSIASSDSSFVMIYDAEYGFGYKGLSLCYLRHNFIVIANDNPCIYVLIWLTQIKIQFIVTLFEYKIIIAAVLVISHECINCVFMFCCLLTAVKWAGIVMSCSRDLIVFIFQTLPSFFWLLFIWPCIFNIIKTKVSCTRSTVVHCFHQWLFGFFGLVHVHSNTNTHSCQRFHVMPMIYDWL